MGLMDSVLGAVTGGGKGPDHGALAGVLQGLLKSNGGLSGLGDRFKQQGLEKVFAGWVSTGPNPEITGDQLQGVLGADTLSQLAGQLGMDGKQASGLLAKFLPEIVDQLTPNGKIESHINVDQGLAGLLPGLLKGGLGKLLGG